MRRRDREVTSFDELPGIMRRCDVCRLTLNGNDGFPYIVPLNFGIQADGKGSVGLVFHSALEGCKFDLMRTDNRASYEMDCEHFNTLKTRVTVLCHLRA